MVNARLPTWQRDAPQQTMVLSSQLKRRTFGKIPTIYSLVEWIIGCTRSWQFLLNGSIFAVQNFRGVRRLSTPLIMRLTTVSDGMGVRRNFSKGATSTFFVSCWRCNANGCSQNALPFLLHKENGPWYNNQKNKLRWQQQPGILR